MARKAAPKAQRTREKVKNPPGYLATHDLKERGWTARLIERFLGQNDAERPNGLKMGRRRLPPVRLYREERVDDAEREEEFILARMKAEDARDKRQQGRERRDRERRQLLESAAESYSPRVQPLALRKGAVRKARAPHLPELERTLTRLGREVGGLKGGDEEALRELLMRRLHLVLAEVYDWYPHPDGPREVEAQEKEPGGDAKPSDWRDWDWDEA
ncbi:hypothetical protein [Deinococcus radiophilus]|uniref:Uncharacterized protein n=1 Tax=Deinococcus radiophilus TaxID=32062 RepID=A0A431W452_9DEIO|nr:hypothetical protein [Deinococcus radiophilus]RTR30241.1 hypothetical protein EJ104_01655 [Deinococcus radiophilus]UFA49967.1 hypothetical protein LMT64_08745 [Deinococcus radiophilus]